MSKRLQRLKEKLAEAKAQLKEKNEGFKAGMKLLDAAKKEFNKHDKITDRLDGLVLKAAQKVDDIEHDIRLEKELIETKKQKAKEKAAAKEKSAATATGPDSSP